MAAPWSLLFLAAAVLLPALAASVEEDGRVADLLRRQAASPDGVIKLDDAAVRKLASSKGRSYSLLILFDALQLRERSELKLDELRQEFGLAAKAYIQGNPDGGDGDAKLFFCTLEFQDTQASFASFGVKSLPHVRYLAPGSSPPGEAESLDMNNEWSRSAEGLASFVESKTGRKVGQIIRPPLLSGRQLGILAALVAVVSPWVARKAFVLAVRGGTPLHDAKVWCAGAIFVFFFSASGGMHNIIRKMPMYMMDRKDPSKLVFFYQGSGAQLGVEGFTVGYLYAMVGLVLAFVTHLVPSFASKNAQRLAMLVAMLACYWSVSKVVSLDHWKTGYGIHAFIPKSWH